MKKHNTISRGIFILCAIIVLKFSPAATLRVAPQAGSGALHEAIAAAAPHDTILVHAGTYAEGGFIVDKPLTLIGIGNPVIDGEFKDEIFLIRSDSVIVKGFTFRNSAAGFIRDYAAVKVENGRHCQILFNKFENNFFAIYLGGARHCRVEGNHITGEYDRETNSGNGIHLWKCDSIRVENNFIDGHRDGIYFEFVKESFLRGNVSQNCIRYGLHFMFSDRNSYENNIFRNNGAGVAVMYTSEMIMRGNLFEYNWGSASYGLLLKDIDRSVIEDNMFLENTTALFIDGSSKLHIRGNIFKSNGWAVKILGNTTEDTIASNNFMTNAYDVSTNGSLETNFFTGNYWDKYRGYDLDKDGVGDVPYRPVSLFAIVIERIPNAVMLMRSLVADILDQVEKVYPDAIPAELADPIPAMHELKLKENPFWIPPAEEMDVSDDKGPDNEEEEAPLTDAGKLYLRKDEMKEEI